MRHRSDWSCGLLLLCIAPWVQSCGSEPTWRPPPSPGSGVLPPEPATKPTDTAAAPKQAGAAAGRFENPGGMWMPEQLATHEGKLRALGLKLDPAALTQPKAYPLGAVVSLGGCTGSFVSPEGLVVTNHHCVTRALQVHSTPEKNLSKEGFAAKSRAEEKPAGPTQRVYVTQGFRDVTNEVRDGIEKLPGDLERHKKMEERMKALIAGCEKDRPAIRCNVASYYGGALYLLIEQLELRDVRLVYAPRAGIGNYGGEVDNWHWPRHTGDFALLRVYVGKDGKPADHAEGNVPYSPPHHLKLASSPLREGDMVFVAGYPGVINRLKTAGEVDDAIRWSYPRQIKMSEEAIAVLEKEKQKDPVAAIKADPMIRNYNNRLTKMRGIMDGLVKGGLAAQRAKIETDLKQWIDADPARKAAYGDVLGKFAALREEQKKTREHDAALREVFFSIRLLDAAYTLTRMAEERPKPDAQRDPAYQERNWKRLEQSLASLDNVYHRNLDQALLTLALGRMARLPQKDRPELLQAVAGAETTPAAIQAGVTALYASTTLENKAERLKLFKSAKTDELKKTKDGFLRLALALRPAMKAREDREDAYDAAIALLRPRYVDALRNFTKGELAPDANGTLRITYGTVRGYQPQPNAPVYRPFTTVSEVVKKHTGKEPFDTPTALLEAAKAKKFGPYVDSTLGEVPVDFLSDLDITGGNSGSPTLNARGELVGLAFDGNYEAMASDWLFMPSITRTIHVDLRYMLWVMDAVDHVDSLIKEMGAAPAVE